MFRIRTESIVLVFQMINNTESAGNSTVFSNPVEQVMREYAENSEYGRNNSRLLIKKNEYNCNFFLPKMRRENLYHERYIKKSLKYYDHWHQKNLYH